MKAELVSRRTIRLSSIPGRLSDIHVNVIVEGDQKAVEGAVKKLEADVLPEIVKQINEHAHHASHRVKVRNFVMDFFDGSESSMNDMEPERDESEDGDDLPEISDWYSYYRGQVEALKSVIRVIDGTEPGANQQ